MTDWATNTLGRTCDIYNGNTINADYKKKHFTGLKEGYPFIATKDVSFDGEIDYENGVRIPFNTRFKKAEDGSVFICAEGGSAGKKIARVTQTVCFGNKLFCIRPKVSSVDSSFLYYFLLSDVFKRQFKESLSGLIGGVSARKFQSFSIHYPSLSEQKEIVASLNLSFSKIDTLKRNAKEAYDEALEVYRAHLCDCITPQDSWTICKIKDVISDIRYGTSRPSTENGKFTYLRMNNISSDGHLVLKDLKTISLPENELEKCLVKKGDILFNRTNSLEHVGKTCVFDIDEPMVIAGYIIRIRLQKRILPKYFSFFLNSACTKKVLRDIAVGAVHQSNISAKSIQGVSIAFPSLSEQERIVTDLEAFEDKINRLRSNYDTICEECELMKQKLLKDYFE